MSLLKWTLAMAGTVMGLRYMSDRHRRRIGADAGSRRAAQTDRDDDRGTILPAGPETSTPWAAPQGVGGLAGVTTGAAIIDADGLQAADHNLAPCSAPSRF